jgi:hypothetical protein
LPVRHTIGDLQNLQVGTVVLLLSQPGRGGSVVPSDTPNRRRMMMKAKASTAKVAGFFTVEGVRTLYAADGVTVKDQRAVLKLNRGILSKRFLVPMDLFTVDQINKELIGEGEFFPPDTELTLVNVEAVHGSWRTYEANVSSIIRPLDPTTLKKLVNSQTIVKEPK